MTEANPEIGLSGGEAVVPNGGVARQCTNLYWILEVALAMPDDGKIEYL